MQSHRKKKSWKLSRSSKGGNEKDYPSAASLAEELNNHLAVQSSLCSRLELIADQLPSCVDRQDCLLIARSIYPVIHKAHEFEEKFLFPALPEICKGEPGIQDTVERLRYEHWEDEAFAGELCESLIRFVTEPDSSNVESLSYMLRGFFEGMRRHIAFEREYIIPKLVQVS